MLIMRHTDWGAPAGIPRVASAPLDPSTFQRYLCRARCYRGPGLRRPARIREPLARAAGIHRVHEANLGTPPDRLAFRGRCAATTAGPAHLASRRISPGA